MRTAYRGAESYHNSNRITFKSLKNFRALATGLLTLNFGTSAQLHPPFERDVFHYTALVAANATTIPVTVGGSGAVEVNGKTLQLASGTAVFKVPFPKSSNSTTVTIHDDSKRSAYTIGEITTSFISLKSVAQSCNT